MTTYNVFSLGNALVDKEYEVSDSFFTKHNINKGEMTLLDAAQFDTRIKTLDQTYTLVKRASGGSATNSVVALSHFGGSAYYCFRVANDETGKFYTTDLTAAGIDFHTQSIHTEGNTGECIVMVTPDAERTMNTYLGVSAEFDFSNINTTALAQSEWLYIEGYLVSSDSARKAAIQVKAQAKSLNKKIAMTFSDPAMVRYFKAGIDEVVAGGVDLLFCNAEEAIIWTNTENLESAMEQLKPHAKQIAITNGKSGALLFDGTSTLTVKGFEAKAIDTNGAGDMFAGAFLYGLSEGWSFEQSGLFGSFAASKVVAQFGPRLPIETHQLLLNEFKTQILTTV